MIYLNGIPVEATFFPDRTSQVWKLPKEQLEQKSHLVRWEFEQEHELIRLAQLKKLLDVECPQAGISLDITYLPYARQDKEISNTTTFALHVFADILNSLHFYDIEICDPHSEVALNLIKRSRAVYPTEKLEKVINLTEINVFCYPDKGAVKKYSGLYKSSLIKFPFIYGEKVRDQLTGYITSYELFGNPSGKNVLIVDDLCDGGATFIILAKELIARGAAEVNLFITHGIFSKGLKGLHESGIKRIFTQMGEAKTNREQHVIYGRV